MSAVEMALRMAGRVVQIRRGTWIALGVGFLILCILLVWAAIALFGWLWGQGKTLAGETPDVARVIASQVEQAVPGAQAALGGLLPALKPDAAPVVREVSGVDVGPVPRYPGLVRSHWQRNGQEVTVRYEGRAEYAAVLEHYTRGFVAQGFEQNLIAASVENEEHEYRKGEERVRFLIAQLSDGHVQATIIAAMP